MKHLQAFEELFYNSSGEKYWGDMGAGILPLCLEEGGPVFLISERGPEANEPGTWGVWGGMIEKHEKDPKRAALREFREETEYNGKIIITPSYIFRAKGFVYYNFLGVVPKRFEPVLDWETSDFKWATMEEMVKMDLHFGLKSLLENGKEDIENIIKKGKS